MSSIDIPACAGTCTVYTGAYRTVASGLTTFIWDQDLHVPAMDGDSDGLSDTLENQLGTLSWADDTDLDGLKDGEEVYGIDLVDPTLGLWMLRLPMYGAQPTVPDLFLEADWLQCVDAPIGTCGAPPDPDKYQFKSVAALSLVNDFFAPAGVALHLDNGISNLDTGARLKYNNWGGASRYATYTDNKCDKQTASRSSFFHFARLVNAGGQAGTGACLDTSAVARTASHELGHNMNLQHGAIQTGGLLRNCEPNYKSLMNYAFDGFAATKWSDNHFAATPLNPTNMNETTGLNTTDPNWVSHINQAPFLFGYNAGAIDWNRDGSPTFDTSVRAAPNWMWAQCDMNEYMFDVAKSFTNRNGSALTWAVIDGEARLFWFTHRSSDNKIEWRYATTTPDVCATQPPHTNPACNTNWYPPLTSAPLTVNNVVQGSGSPAAGRAVINGQITAVLAYSDVVGRLRYHTLQSGSNMSWSVPQYVDNSVTTLTPAAFSYNNELYLYAPLQSNRMLQEWKLQTNGQWSAPVAQVWSGGGGGIELGYGIAAAWGAVRDNNTFPTRFFAAIPRYNPLGQTEVAIKVPGSSEWSAIANWPVGKPLVAGQPGLAWVPFAVDGTAKGRLVLLYYQVTGGPAYLWESEGNDVTPGATYGRLRFLNQTRTYWSTAAGTEQGNTVLLYDRYYDHNLRSATTTYPTGVAAFIPYMDGQMNGEFRDQDDGFALRRNLSCALNKGTCY